MPKSSACSSSWSLLFQFECMNCTYLGRRDEEFPRVPDFSPMPLGSRAGTRGLGLFSIGQLPRLVQIVSDEQQCAAG